MAQTENISFPTFLGTDLSLTTVLTLEYNTLRVPGSNRLHSKMVKTM
jgi:hypothetical protein